MSAQLVRAIDAASRLGIPASDLYSLVDQGQLRGHRRADRLWVDLDEARAAIARRGDVPSSPT